MRAGLLLIALTIATTALAEPTTHVHPFGPTDATAIDLHFKARCAGGYFSVGWYNRTIYVRRIGGCYGSGSLVYDTTVRLAEQLASGQYHVEVVDERELKIAETDFYVRSTWPQHLTVHPTAVPIAGGVRMRIDGVVCPIRDCEVRIGDIRIKPLTSGADGALWFTAPPHAKGQVQVSLFTHTGIFVASNLAYYYDGFDKTIVERILFPVLAHTRGFGGSEWVSEGVISNPNPWFIGDLRPGATTRIGDGYPRGFALVVPRGEVDSLAFALRIRDTSCDAEGLGTRVPVVREKDMFHGRDITLLNVPRDPHYRVKVRVYAFDPMFDTKGRVRTKNGSYDIELRRTGTADDEPYYAELDLPSAADRTDVTIVPPRGSLAWAFATVTNNETQQVTVVKP
jgi:hypothetical protein